MDRGLAAALVFAAVLATACGGEEPASEPASDPTSVANALLATMDNMVDALESVKTEADVESAKPKLADVAGRMKRAHDAFQQMSEAEQATFKEIMGRETPARRERSRNAMMGVPKPLFTKLEAAMADALRNAGADPNAFR